MNPFGSTIRVVLCLTFSASAAAVLAEVPKLAQTKAAAEAGDPRAQYEFAMSFTWMDPRCKQWLTASAQQGYGPAEDELAWSPNWASFASFHADPKARADYLARRGPEMQHALLHAASAADKGFSRSRLLLAYAHTRGYLVGTDYVEAYKWILLYKTGDMMADMRHSSLKNELLKVMSIDQIKQAEARTASCSQSGTVASIFRTIVIPKIRLTATAATGAGRMAMISGTAFEEGQTHTIEIDGLSVTIVCRAIKSSDVEITLPPTSDRYLLRVNQAPTLRPQPST